MDNEDLSQIDDALEYVRARPAMFFSNGRFTAEELALQLVREALQWGVPSVEVVRSGGWTIVHSPVDWLGKDATAAFHRIIPFPEGGQNAMRMEIVATAFAESVITKAEGRTEQIAGTPNPAVLEIYADHGRAVAVLGTGRGNAAALG